MGDGVMIWIGDAGDAVSLAAETLEARSAAAASLERLGQGRVSDQVGGGGAPSARTLRADLAGWPRSDGCCAQRVSCGSTST
jgi:hypothetical protein